MKLNSTRGALLALALVGMHVSVRAQRVDVGSGSVVQAVLNLRPGEFVWEPKLAPEGPALLVVNTITQRAIFYRNGVPIAVTTVSTGRPGYETPTGMFTILQKRVEHYSSTYDNAPMPYMQRLTWKGIALHAGQLPGRPASHGCIRLPLEFARLLYGVTQIGMTVVVTELATLPRVAPTPEFALAGRDPQPSEADMRWNPDKARLGPVSILVSAADGRATVLRNGIEIGAAPVRFREPVDGTWAYALQKVDETGQHWLRIQLSGDEEAGRPVSPEEWRRFDASEPFRRAVASVVEPGTTVIITADSLKAGGPADLTVMEDAGEAPL